MSQTRAIGEMIHYYSQRYAEAGVTLAEGLNALMRDIENGGLDAATVGKRGDLAMPRLIELAAAINRMRSLIVR